MTTFKDRPQHVDTPPIDTLERRSRILTITVTILSAVVLVLGAWIVNDLSTGSDSPTNAAITQLLDDYTAALGPGAAEAWDAKAFGNVVTDDFAIGEFYYRLFGDTLAKSTDTFEMDEISLSSTWELRETSEPVITGDGPWIAAKIDNWGDSKSDGWGIGVFVVVDDNGTLKVADKYWIGIGIATE